MEKLVLLGLGLGGAISFFGFEWSSLIGLLGLLFLCFIGMLYTNQEKLLYQPLVFPQFAVPSQNPDMYKHPAEYSMTYDNLYLDTNDGHRLHAWHMRHSDPLPKPTLLYLHANAGNMGFCLPNINQFYTALRLNVFVVSYRGYGESSGEPHEDGLVTDAACAMEYLLNSPYVDRSKIIVFGRSLGGAVAISLAEKYQNNIAGWVLENTFTSVSDLVDSIFPYLRPLKHFILRLKWPSAERIRAIHKPVLFLAAQQDEIVPSSHMEKLYSVARRSRRTFVRFPTGTHNDTWMKSGYVETIAQWLLSLFPSHALAFDVAHSRQHRHSQHDPADDHEHAHS